MSVKQNEVYVTYGRFSDDSTCQECKNPDKYLVLAGGGQLSNLEGNCCDEHLNYFIEEGKKTLLKYKRKDIKVKYHKIILRENKLKRILKEEKL